ILVALALLVSAALLGLFWANRITRPIEEFSMAARVVAKGQFDVHLEPASRDEIGELADSFNQMTSELKGREQALQDAQSALIQSEKLAALGQFSAGIAHEVRNPLVQVLMNLLINAQQAMEGRPGSVKIATRLAQGDQIEIQVHDTGPGIPEEIQAKIFEPFFTTKPVGKGTGLGLSVSYGIVKNHKGDIRVESGAGQGATFTVSLPAAKAPEVAAVTGEKAPSQP